MRGSGQQCCSYSSLLTVQNAAYWVVYGGVGVWGEDVDTLS